MEAVSKRFEIMPCADSGIECAVLFQLYKNALKDHIEAAFGWQEVQQRSRFEKSYPSHEISVFYMKSEFAGFMAIRNEDNNKHIALLLLKPSLRRQGIGREIMEVFHIAARESTQTLTLSCFKTNLAALAFYKSLGYRPLSQDPFFVDLHWNSDPK